MKKPIIFYSIIWVALVASFWLGLRNDAFLYSVIMDTVLIAFSVTMPWSIVKRQPTRKTQCIVIAATGLLAMLAEYLTFSLSNNIAFGKINMPSWSMFFIAMFLAFVDTEIGLTVLKKEGSKKQRILKLVGKILAAYIIVSLLVTIGEDPGFDRYCKSIAGDYQAVEVDNPDDPDSYVGGYWHLSISKEDGWYLSIYDNEAGNPGIEGNITNIDDESVTIEYDPDYYDQLPSARWKIEGKYLKMKYNKKADAIELTNNNHTIKFERDFDE